MPSLRPTMMLGLNGNGCLRQASSCGAGAWAWAVATLDVIHQVSSWDICLHTYAWSELKVIEFDFANILYVIRVVP